MREKWSILAACLCLSMIVALLPAKGNASSDFCAWLTLPASSLAPAGSHAVLGKDFYIRNDALVVNDLTVVEARLLASATCMPAGPSEVALNRNNMLVENGFGALAVANDSSPPRLYVAACVEAVNITVKIPTMAVDNRNAADANILCIV